MQDDFPLQPPRASDGSTELSRVTSVNDYQWVLVLTTFTTLIVGWAFLGQIPETVTGRGLLVGPGNIRRVYSEATGIIKRIYHRNGDDASQNAVLIDLDIPDLRLTAKLQKSLISELSKAYSSIDNGYNSLLTTKEADLDALNLSLLAQLQLSRQQTDSLFQFTSGLRELVGIGAVSKQLLLTSQQNYAAQLEKQRGLEQQLRQVKEQKKELSLSNEKDKTLQRINYLDRKATADLEISKYERSSQIRAPLSGRVFGLTFQVGDEIKAEQPVATMIIDSREGMLRTISANVDGEGAKSVTFAPSTALLFFSSSASDLARAGDDVSLTPDGYSQSEYGGIKGRLLSIANLSSTRENLIAETGTIARADQLIQQGLTYVGVAQLETDESTPSGYRWTSGNGPERPVTLGTSVSVQVTTRYRAPISYVLPFLRNWTGIFRF